MSSPAMGVPEWVLEFEVRVRISCFSARPLAFWHWSTPFAIKGIRYEYEMLFTHKSDCAIRLWHSSAWHSSSNTSEVDNLMSCVKIVRTLPTGSLGHSSTKEGILLKEGFRGSKQWGNTLVSSTHAFPSSALSELWNSEELFLAFHSGDSKRDSTQVTYISLVSWEWSAFKYPVKQRRHYIYIRKSYIFISRKKENKDIRYGCWEVFLHTRQW